MSTVQPPVKPGESQISPISFGESGIRLQSLEDAWRFSKYIIASGLAPKGFDKPEAVLIALQHCAELGLPPLAGLQNIGVINGRPGIYGDAALALIRKSGLSEYVSEYYEVGGKKLISSSGKIRAPFPAELKDETCTAVCLAKRRDEPEESVGTFSVADAKLASLLGKQGPWAQYPARMLRFRARGFALRDAFGDVLKGLRTLEELGDMPPVQNVTPPRRGLVAMIEGTPDATPPPVPQVKSDTTGNREEIIGQLEEYMLDAGVSETSLLREIMDSQLVENADGLALFELPTESLGKVAAYTRTKAATVKE